MMPRSNFTSSGVALPVTALQIGYRHVDHQWYDGGPLNATLETVYSFDQARRTRGEFPAI